jgi:GTPase-associated protein 1, middle domain
MEQIYYTQCPVGYGLGASNGFQVKRLSRGYPMSGDFRHLGLRAFPGGGRSLAPPTLRYRRDGEIAEIAWLTPRSNEYETERGLWGRPGGHFAHGLRLDAAELKALKRWPAGLFDSAIWKRTDREPSRGRPPDELDLGSPGWFRPSEFAEVAPLAEGIDPDRLARLLTALARVTREGRTLYLIDEPSKLGPLIALLTFAFPEKLRDDLTFSTYHDRPEELPGLRLSGTIPLARPNKPALTAQGIVADLTLGTFEPRIEPASWARTLANWLVKHDPVDEADWSATDGRARAAKLPMSPESPWSDDWLGSLHAYPEALRTKTAPGEPSTWQELTDFTRWLTQTNLGDEWVRPRNPAWWLEAAGLGKEVAEARGSLVVHLALRDAWRGDSQPSAWGDVVAAWFRDVEPSERDTSIDTILQSSPKSKRPAFARALLRGLTPEGADAVLNRLRDDPSVDRAMLLPLEASAAVAAILGGSDPATLRGIVEESLSFPGATSAVLDAVEAGVVDQPESLPVLTASITAAFDLEAPGEAREGLAWALRRGSEAIDWLAPALRPVLADPGRQDLWAALLERTPEDARPSLARTVLAIATDPGLPDEAFRWGIEAVLLPLAPRPSQPRWAETYLSRTASDLDLLRRLVAPENRKLGVLAWLNQARSRSELSPEQAARIDSCLDYARALNSKDPNSLLKIHVPNVPNEERGLVLGQMLSHVGGTSLEGLPFVLDAARQAWPGAFQPGAAGLRSLANPLAKCLAPLNLTPAPYFARLTKILERLNLTQGLLRGFEPDGLAAEIVAASPRIAGATADPWPLRQYLLRLENAWRTLTVDVRRDLAEVKPKQAADVLARWDQKLTQEKPERFFELFLNACDAPRLASVVSARAADFKTLPPLPWWDHVRHAEALDDLRDGYARTVPLAPLEEGRLFVVRNWVDGSSKKPAQGGPATLSTRGLVRWRCLEALTNFQNAGRGPEVRLPIVNSWEADLPVQALPPDDRYRLVAWVILGLDSAEPYQLARLATWLKRSGIKDPPRLARWAEEIEDLTEIPGDLKLFRSGMVAELRGELFRLLKDEKESKEGKPPRPLTG